jgi:hypothetical protein
MLENLNVIEVFAGCASVLVFIYVGSRLATHAYFRSKLDYFRTTSRELDISLRQGETDAKE